MSSGHGRNDSKDCGTLQPNPLNRGVGDLFAVIAVRLLQALTKFFGTALLSTRKPKATP
jgi:hypothetical protein